LAVPPRATSARLSDNLVPAIGEGHREVESQGRLADPAFFIGDGDDPGIAARPACDIAHHDTRMFSIHGHIAAAGKLPDWRDDIHDPTPGFALHLQCIRESPEGSSLVDKAVDNESLL
jgi:hypothetical protein